MKWGLAITNPAERGLRKLSREEQEHLNRVFDLMRNNPFHGDIKFLRGGRGTIRRRIGDIRIFYDLHQDIKVIVITAVERRSSKTY